MMQHEDFMGNYGRLGPGDVQWMTAGRGVVHSEMPYFDPDPSQRSAAAVALQLWVDLPAAKKMVKPSYKDKKASALARASFPGGSVAVVSGESHGAVGPIRPVARCWFLDFTLDSGAETWQQLPEGWTAFVYVLEGAVILGDSDENSKNTVPPHHCGVLTSSAGETGVRLHASSPTRFVLIAGEPLDQPMILQGPFVVTTKDAAVQALRDFQGGRNGFEKAPGWQSAIGKEVGVAGGGAARRKGKSRKEGEEHWEERDPAEKGRGKGKRRDDKEKEEEEVVLEKSAKGKNKGRR
jgi:redox-sensitive bicupin YhaK (pirin superfamily)